MQAAYKPLLVHSLLPVSMPKPDSLSWHVILRQVKLMCHNGLSSSPGSNWCIMTGCHLHLVQVDVSGQTVILPGSSWCVMTGCQLVLGEDDGPSWCHVIRSCPVMTLCDQADHLSWWRWWLSSESRRIGAAIQLQKCQKFLLCSLNKYNSTRFTMIR